MRRGAPDQFTFFLPADREQADGFLRGYEGVPAEKVRAKKAQGRAGADPGSDATGRALGVWGVALGRGDNAWTRPAVPAGTRKNSDAIYLSFRAALFRVCCVCVSGTAEAAPPRRASML